MSVRDQLPVKGFRHQKCYAAEFSDCSSTISLEHYLSKNIYKTIAIRGVSGSEGFRWGDKAGTASADAASANILCVHHNERLGVLDDDAGRFFKYLQSVMASIYQVPGGAQKATMRTHTIDGYMLERWLLKMMAGRLASGHVFHEGRQRKIVIEKDLLKVLFGKTRLVRPNGLYFATKIVEQKVALAPEVAAGVIMDGDKPLGMSCSFNGLIFYLMVPGNWAFAIDLPSDALYRQQRLVGRLVNVPEETFEIRLTW